MKWTNFFSAIIFFTSASFSFLSAENFKSLQVLPQSEIFFTQTENCYSLELDGVQPAKVQMDLPELPLGTKFISSKKEEVINAQGQRGTLITLWFTFAYTGNTRIPPLMTRINGRTHFFEFQPVYVYENPALISPILEITFDSPHKISGGSKNSKRAISVQKGEKLRFTISLKYGTQILDFKWKIPKDSIFAETERFEFANGGQKITEFTTEGKNLAKFEWQILKEGEYSLPEIIIAALSYNGVKKTLYLPQDIIVSVSPKTHKEADDEKNLSSNIFEEAFQPSQTDIFEEKNSAPSKEECKKIAENSRRKFCDIIFSRKFAVFAGGEIYTVPETKSRGQTFAGGQKVRVTETAGDWAFIECKEFSGWAKNDSIFLIK